MSTEPRQPQDKYVLRLPDGMRDRIKAAAESNNRSMNAEIVARLQATLETPLWYETNYAPRAVIDQLIALLEDERKRREVDRD